MPYILQIERGELDIGGSPKSPGQLNYVFSRLASRYLERNGLSYQTINDVLGAFDGASKEFYRRVAVNYEERKRATNGDVYSEKILL